MTKGPCRNDHVLGWMISINLIDTILLTEHLCCQSRSWVMVMLVSLVLLGGLVMPGGWVVLDSLIMLVFWGHAGCFGCTW